MKNKRFSDWLAPAAAALSLVACYGTLAATGLLGALGAAISLNESLWAGTIVVFAWLALLALWIGRRRHASIRPIVLAAVGVALITLTMSVAYERIIELVGFAFLGIGTFLDWRARDSDRGPVK